MRKLHYRGAIRQIPIYLGKFFRMFIYMSDWKVLPMSALIAMLVSYVACNNMFKYMEGATMGSMALTCACLWNGCFNSIQAVCRERDIVKREHRSGMRIASYISAHMIYQGFLCLMQTIITITVCRFMKIPFPTEGFITPFFLLDIGITLFLITFSADMMSLMISCVVRNTTSAMTVMPLVLIVQLVFSGILFTLDGSIQKFSKLTIANWGMRCINSQANYNSLPMVSVWNQIFKFRNYEVNGLTPVKTFTDYIEQNNLRDDFLRETAAQQFNPVYDHTVRNIASCWGMLLLFTIVFVLLSMLFLSMIDKDKR